MKFLESPMQTIAVGFGLAMILIMGYLAMVGIAVGDADWFGLLLRWVHFLAGIVWIGMLQPGQCVVLEELGWPHEKHRDSQADACRARLVPSWRHDYGACGNCPVSLHVSKRWNRGDCIGNRRPLGHHYDGQCSRDHLAESTKDYCGRDGSSSGDSRTA
jgi:hypothetical protein